MASCDDRANSAAGCSPARSSRELLFVDKQDDGIPKTFLINKNRGPDVGAPPEIKTFRLPESSLLGRLKEFMPVMQAANSQLLSAPLPSSLVDFAEDSDMSSEADSDDEGEHCASDVAKADRKHTAAAARDAASASHEPYVEMRLALVLNEDSSDSDGCSADDDGPCDNTDDVAASQAMAEDVDFISSADICEVTSENLKMPTYCRKKPPCIEELSRD